MSDTERCKRSEIWNYFELNAVEPTKAQCKFCKSKISRGGKTPKTFNTSNLVAHLKSVHKEDYAKFEFEQAENKTKRIKLSESQPTIDHAFRAAVKWSIDDKKASKVHLALSEMIALDFQPFSIVEDAGFRRFVNILEPRYTIPSRKYFSEKMIPEIYYKMKTQVQLILDQEGWFSFTTDAWSSSSEGFLSLTCQWITNEFKRKQALLHVLPITDSHTGEALSQHFDGMLAQWSITKDKVHAFLRDNAKNIVKGCELSGFYSIACFAHSLQLVVNEGLLAQRVVKDVLAIGRSIVSHFRHSVLAKERLHKIQDSLGMQEQNLVQDEPTRWDSSLLMLKSLQKQKRAIIVYSAEHDLPALNMNQWCLIDKLVDVLTPFHEATLEISKRSSCASEIIPMVRGLSKLLDSKESGLLTMQMDLKSALRRRFGHLEQDKNLVLATTLDPRYRFHFFLLKETKNQASKWLKELPLSEFIREGGPEMAETGEKSENDSAVSTCSRSRLWSAIADIVNAETCELISATSNRGSDALDEEMSAYLRSDLLSHNSEREGDPLAWWADKQPSFPRLAKMARRYLSPPASSVQSEQLFSAAGNIYTKRRQALLGEKAEMLLFIKSNYQIVNDKL